MIGDFVWSTNPETGEQELKAVAHLIQGNKEYELFIISFDNAEIVTATSDHPFFVNGDWVNAKELRIGDETLSITADKPIRVASIETVVRTEKVFNLTVDEFHTFHVGDAGYLVHNANIFCSSNVTAFFPKVNISGLIRNRPLNELTGNQLYNAFKKSGYKLGGHLSDQGHAISRFRDPRTRALGFNTLGDVAAIINRGVKVDAGNGDVAFGYRGMEIIIDPVGMEIKTIRPARRTL